MAMADGSFRVEVAHDHLRKLTNASPVQAVCELVWNSLDADATRVDVDVDRGELGMLSVSVRDNGHGFTHEEARALFGKVGGSWKRHGAKSKRKSRVLHGKEGKGRLKALALGRVADWIVRYRDEAGNLMGFKMTLVKDALVDVEISAPEPAEPALGTGVEVTISELEKQFKSLEAERAVPDFSSVFAIYLKNYRDAEIFFDGERLDPEANIASSDTISLDPIEADGGPHPVVLEVIQWNSAPERSIFLCGKDGFPFARIAPKFHTTGYVFSAYLKSAYVDRLQERGVIDLAEMDAAMADAVDQASEALQVHFKEASTAKARSEIERWKEERSYPYEAEPTTKVETAERQVFDIVALTVNKHLSDFSQQSAKGRAFQMRMLRQAIERGPDELQTILTQVLDLPQRTMNEFAKLLEEADLANVISASKMVADRLSFLSGIEQLLYDPETRGLLKERSQLHRMIAEGNTWIFGEEFGLTVDDKGLTEVLRKHRSMIGDDTIIDAPVKRIDGSVGVVDLMLSRSVPRNRPEEREHLVVELKRPSVVIGSKELTQVESYAFAIANDERFRDLDTRWVFWAVSNDIDAHARRRARQEGNPPGRVFKDGPIEIWVKAWSEVLSDAKGRMRFVQDKLKSNVDDDAALNYLKKTYAKYLEGIADDAAPDASSANVDAENASEG